MKWSLGLSVAACGDPDEGKGAVDAHFDPPASTGFELLDVKFTFTCPSRR
jgi:hypothetical protein